MKQIEEGIHELHAKAREKKENDKETQEEREMEGEIKCNSLDFAYL